MSRIRVILADDNELIRAGVRRLLARAPEFEVIAEARNGREAIDLSLSLKPDLILMDLRMPECDGASATRCILDGHPKAKIVVVTSDDSGHAEKLARSAGAVATVTKDECITALIPKLRLVVQDDRCDAASGGLT